MISALPKPTDTFSVFRYQRNIRSADKTKLSAIEKIILWELSDRYGADGKIYPSNQCLANATGFPIQTIRNNLSSLKRKGFIDYKIQRNRNRRYITLIDPETNARYGPALYSVKDSTVLEPVHSIKRTNPTNTHRTTTDPPTASPQHQPPPIQPQPPVAPSGADAVSFADKKTALELKNKIDPERKSTVSLALISQMMLVYSIAQITGLIEKINKNKLISNPGGYLRKILNEKAELPEPDAEKIKIEKARQAEIEKLREQEKLTRESQELKTMVPEPESSVQTLAGMELTDKEKSDLIRKYALTKPVGLMKKWASKSWDELNGKWTFAEWALKELIE
jgi:Helix-turn-helix domain